jgi:hypothetical protein
MPPALPSFRARFRKRREASLLPGGSRQSLEASRPLPNPSPQGGGAYCAARSMPCRGGASAREAGFRQEGAAAQAPPPCGEGLGRGLCREKENSAPPPAPATAPSNQPSLNARAPAGTIPPASNKIPSPHQSHTHSHPAFSSPLPPSLPYCPRHRTGSRVREPVQPPRVVRRSVMVAKARSVAVRANDRAPSRKTGTDNSRTRRKRKGRKRSGRRNA